MLFICSWIEEARIEPVRLKVETCLHSDDLVMLGILVSKHICRKVHLNWVVHNQSLLNAGTTRVSARSNLNAVPRKFELLGDVGDGVLCKRFKGASKSTCSGELLTIGYLSWSSVRPSTVTVRGLAISAVAASSLPTVSTASLSCL